MMARMPTSAGTTAPSLTGSLLIALLLALASSLAIPLLVAVIGLPEAARLAVALCGGAWLLATVRLDRAPSGVPTAVAAWLFVAIAVGLFVAEFPAYVAAHAALLWLVRTILVHRRAGPAAIDAFFCIASFAAAALALSRTGSTFLTVWSFFFVQAGLAWLTTPTDADRADAKRDPFGAFSRAQRQAESALAQLINR